MKRPRNRMAKVETMETEERFESVPVIEPETKRTPDRCPACNAIAPVLVERIRNDRIIRRRQCSQCGVQFTEVG
jgi:transposase